MKTGLHNNSDGSTGAGIEVAPAGRWVSEEEWQRIQDVMRQNAFLVSLVQHLPGKLKKYEEKIAFYEKQIESYRKELEECKNKLALYESPHMSSSTISTFTKERDNFRKKHGSPDQPAPKERSGRGGASSDSNNATESTDKTGGKKRKGKSHSNKSIETIRYCLHACLNCGRTDLVRMRSTNKQFSDLEEGVMITRTAIIENAKCPTCGVVSAKTPIPHGSSLGPNALRLIVELRAAGLTDSRIANFMDAWFDFLISKNAVWNARKAIARMFKKLYERTLELLAKSSFVHIDETPMKINGKQGSVFVATTDEITHVHAAHSRSKEAFLEHFSCLLNTPAVVDGYIMYHVIDEIQRCMIHILRDTEKCAIVSCRNGETDTNEMVQYERFREIYHIAKKKGTASEEVILDLNEQVHDIITSYGDRHPMATLLKNALPYMFTFLRHPGMPPHNNPVELEIRDVIVLAKNIQHKLMTDEGMRVFSIISTMIRTCYKQRMFPGMVVAALAYDPDWDMFGGGEPPPEMRHMWRVPRKRTQQAYLKSE